jgi:hypothetical protein
MEDEYLILYIFKEQLQGRGIHRVFGKEHCYGEEQV